MKSQDCLEVFWNKLCKEDKKDCAKKILETYKNIRFGIVNFAYFAVLVKGWILDGKCNEFWKDFLKADLILPDGIALRLRAKKKFNVNLHNLNWDDFLRQFFAWLDKEGMDYKVVGYWGKADPQLMQKTKQEFAKISQKGFEKFFHGYGELPWQELEDLKNYEGLKILLQSRGGPQEHWTVENLDKIQEYGFFVFNVGWLFDHRAWAEPRPPKLIQKAKLEWLRRLVLDPKKNWSKVKSSFRVFKEILR